MFRLFIALTAIATVMTVTAAAPGRKRDERTEWYFPTKVGDNQVYTVTYRSEDGAVVMEQVRTRTVSAVKLASGEAVVTTRDEADVGANPETDVYRVSSQGVFLLSRGTAVYDPPQRELQYPAKAGASWEVVVPGPGDMSLTVTCTSGGEEEVEVPAGKFQAVRVERQFEVAGQVYRQTNWVTPAVGTVKIQAQAPDGSVTHVLKSYTPGKS